MTDPMGDKPMFVNDKDAVVINGISISPVYATRQEAANRTEQRMIETGKAERQEARPIPQELWDRLEGFESPPNTHLIKGKIHSVNLWSRMLTEEEIKEGLDIT